MARKPDYSRFFDDNANNKNNTDTRRNTSSSASGQSRSGTTRRSPSGTGSAAKSVYSRTVTGSSSGSSRSRTDNRRPSSTKRPSTGSRSSTRTSGRNRRRKKNTTIFKKLIISFVVLCIVVGIAGGSWILATALSAEPITDDMLDIANVQTSVVYDINGKKIDYLTTVDNKDRTIISYKKMSPNIINAIVAIEDERFYKHNGFDPYALMRAAVRRVTSGSREGGSTITMQLVKNITLKNDYTIKRKVQEQYLAMNLETRIPKWKVLEMYLNLIHLGSNVYGVEAASLRYFNKHASDLTVPEAACIAAIPKAPTTYSPITDEGKKNCIERQKLVLAAMYKNDYITEEEYEKYKEQEVKFKIKKNNKRSTLSIKTYFTDHVVRELYKDLETKGYSTDGATELIYGGGLKIYTTMDKSVQAKMNKTFNDSSYFPGTASDGSKPQAGMVLLDPTTGQIRALYGGNGKKKGNLVLDRSYMIERQPGSSIKPIAVYGPALDSKAITGGEVIDDCPTWMLGNSTLYPQNADRTYRGLTTLRTAVTNSVNVVAAKVYSKMNPETPLEYLKRAGIERSQKNVALSMGGMDQGVSPLLMAGAYAPFANEGIYLEPISYTKVVDRNGNILLDKLKDPDIKQQSNIVYSNQTAFVMTNILENVCRSGTAAGYGLVKGGNISSAGKTGTTNDTKDKWFCGYTPYYVGTVWHGFDNNAALTSSSNYALRIWSSVMNQVHADLPNKKFTKPSGIKQMSICTKSGDLPGPYCSTESAYFISGTQPKSKCTVHVKVTVCKTSNKLPSAVCKTTSKVFTQRKEPFVSKYNSGRYPSDWSLEVPTATCNGKHANKNQTSNSSPTVTTPSPTDSPTTKATATPAPVNDIQTVTPTATATQAVVIG